jgi:hypothetical protein
VAALLQAEKKTRLVVSDQLFELVEVQLAIAIAREQTAHELMRFKKFSDDVDQAGGNAGHSLHPSIVEPDIIDARWRNAGWNQFLSVDRVRVVLTRPTASLTLTLRAGQ